MYVFKEILFLFLLRFGASFAGRDGGRLQPVLLILIYLYESINVIILCYMPPVWVGMTVQIGRTEGSMARDRPDNKKQIVYLHCNLASGNYYYRH